MKRLLIDTDTAADDAVALVMALTHPEVQVEAITVVAGNVPLAQGLQNALYTVELCQREVPVYAGVSTPLLKSLVTAQEVHGSDGLGDIGLALAGRVPAPGRAVEVIIETIQRYPGEITVVALGPLTNLALALRLEPTIATQVKECIIMGGAAQGPGNVTAVAEYNIWVDPEAARIVLHAGMPITLVDWYISKQYASLSPAEASEIKQLGTPLANFCVDIQRAQIAFNQRQGDEGFVLADPIAMAVALDPEVAVVTKPLFVDVETQSPLCNGQTIVDHQRVLQQQANVNVVLTASHERFLGVLRNALL